MKADRKAALINELEWSRVELSQNLHSVHGDLDMAAHFRHSVVQRKTAWLGGAAIAGWVLSRLSRRKKKPELPSKTENHWKPSLESSGRAGIFIALLNAIFTLLKPVITTFATRKINQLASQGNFGPSRKEPRFR